MFYLTGRCVCVFLAAGVCVVFWVEWWWFEKHAIIFRFFGISILFHFYFRFRSAEYIIYLALSYCFQQFNQPIIDMYVYRSK